LASKQNGMRMKGKDSWKSTRNKEIEISKKGAKVGLEEDKETTIKVAKEAETKEETETKGEIEEA